MLSIVKPRLDCMKTMMSYLNYIIGSHSAGYSCGVQFNVDTTPLEQIKTIGFLFSFQLEVVSHSLPTTSSLSAPTHNLVWVGSSLKGRNSCK